MYVTKCVEFFGNKLDDTTKRSNRSQVQIMAEILSLCRCPQTRTQVKCSASLSWGMLQKYLLQLRLLMLLEVNSSQTNYMTTKKGVNFIERSRDIMELFLPSRRQPISWRRGL